jgi:O-methyltransferase involved in polyketide biosynthesis
MDANAHTRQREQMQRIRALAAKLGEQRDIPDIQQLWYFEEREDVGNWLRRHGWEASVVPAEELMARYDRRPPDIEDAAPRSLFVSAQRL